MNAEMLRSAVAILGGPEFVFGFGFDNTGRVFFSTETPFSFDMIQGEFLVLQEEALQDNIKTISLKPIETIQTIIGVNKSDDKDIIDKHYYRS